MMSHAVPTEQRRLQLLQELLDPVTQRLLENTGLEADWTVLELGAGDGSIARWLGTRCPRGRVVATDTDLRFLTDTDRPPVEVRQHDVFVDDFPPGTFDLIHVRHVLANLPRRDAAIGRLISWLKPGGWLVIEEPDTSAGEQSGYPAMASAMRAAVEMGRRVYGVDTLWSRTLPRLFAEAGLVDLGLLTTAHQAGVGGAANELWRQFLVQLRPAIAQDGLMDEALALFDDPGFADVLCTTISVSARRPH